MLNLALTHTIPTPEGPRPLHVELALSPGERLALYGPSGVGKTTLLRLIAGLARPDQGRIAFGDTVWCDTGRRVHAPARERRVGYVFQDYALFPNMRVRDNLAFAQPTPNRNRLDELLALTRLAPLAERYPHQLSGGQRQRVALARALAQEPQLLLMDEPLSALDPALRVALREEIDEILHTVQLTTVIVSHDLGDVFRLAHRVAVLEPGKVAALGTPRDVLLPPTPGGRHALSGTVLAIEPADVLWRVTVAIGNDTVATLSADVDQLRIGAPVAVQLNGSSAVLQPA
ncbi:sulfate/molybdate ABC transporter ATP-binding protein [Jeongeupia chitinilytica]|uniref:GTPase n=1 Tax=Jeongeupia chitinilytica TaxID=1041641 RepID=A0ABQ3GXF4_9NEIS|nr:ABC transporter ATP-binding protein [Jeongeupia chitinilytica]GHD57052.1 GTPase [Jeongeupia chitinilytica]